MKKLLFHLNRHIRWIFPFIWLLILTPATAYIDLSIERFFYVDGQFNNSYFFQFVYNYVPYISLVFAFFCLLILVFSYLRKELQSWRKYMIMLLLTDILGSGLVVHAVLKDHWGRPRPKQIEEFGGIQQFRPYYKPNFFNQIEPSKSFPCGHASTGFYFLALTVVGMRLNRNKLIYAGIVLGLSLGILLSITRMAQGGHFFSDTVVSGIVMWYAALFSDWIVFRRSHEILYKKTG